MKKINILKKNDDFNYIIKNGLKKTNSHFIIYYVPINNLGFEHYQVGISVGKKIGNAPIRNKQKRIVREILTCNQAVLKENCYVIISKYSCVSEKYCVLEQKLLQILGEIK